jgi:hypothetical protein
MNVFGVQLKMPSFSDGATAILVAALACGVVFAASQAIGLDVGNFSILYVGAVVGAFFSVCGVTVAEQGWKAGVVVMTSSMVIWAALSASGLA